MSVRRVLTETKKNDSPTVVHPMLMPAVRGLDLADELLARSGSALGSFRYLVSSAKGEGRSQAPAGEVFQGRSLIRGACKCCPAQVIDYLI